MSNSTKIEQKLINKHLEKLEFITIKLAFLSDSVKFWDIGNIGFTEDNQYGFSLLMEDVITEINNSVSTLEKA